MATCVPAFAQVDSSVVPTHKKEIDLLKENLAKASDDTTRVHLLQSLNGKYETENVDSSIRYGLEALALSRKMNNLVEQARTLTGLSSIYRQEGRFAESLEALFQARKLAERAQDTPELARSYRWTGAVYTALEDYQRALENQLMALRLDQSPNSNEASRTIDDMVLSGTYMSVDSLDKAIFHAQRAIRNRKALETLIQIAFMNLGSTYEKRGNADSALMSFRTGLQEARKNGDFNIASSNAIGLARVYARQNRLDSARFYADISYSLARQIKFTRGITASANMLADLYGPADPAKALQFSRIAYAARDSLFGAKNTRTVQAMIAREEKQQREAESAAAAFRNRVRLFGLFGGLAVLSILAYVLFRNNRQQRKANTLLREQKQELARALELLKATQAQLIQAEKMASLGELTAGIAHEIQNPLNFVNNFSEVNLELIGELAAAAENGEFFEVKILAADLKENEQKIYHHGKRADGIVKGMLQHSRVHRGVKERVNINALADEYLRLSYHGLRAKDKKFTVKMNTDFDPAIGSVDCVPQDIGRVLLNLFTNAFYAVADKLKRKGGGYDPVVSVQTKKFPGKIQIRIRDNGTGIPTNMLDKIFQPFFTSKPAGEGTGLGLSLSFDVAKAHGGDLTVDSKEGEYCEFILTLPD